MNKKFITTISTFLLLVLSSCSWTPGGGDDPGGETTKHLDVSISDMGYDIYKMPKSVNGYRYGPSIMVHERENNTPTIDAWFATNGYDTQLWDVFSYKHSDNGGASWSEEEIVTWPNPKSLDTYSVCDPAVVKYGNYYYMGYTSTCNSNQRDNCTYVARSTSPKGPWDKWNGTNWGGEPEPITYWDQYGMGSTSYWGSGEPSFVILDNKIFVYYTYEGSGGRETRLLTGDITNPNWPSTLQYQGIALGIGTNDSIDVAYVEEYDKFIALATDNRFSEQSFLAFYESDDGYKFTICDVVKQNTCRYLHNSGLSKNELGHITPTMTPFVGYAYGGGGTSADWGVWNTRFQNITIATRDEIDLSDLDKNNTLVPITRDTRDPSTLNFLSGIVCFEPGSQSDEYACYVGVTPSMTLNVFTYTHFKDHYIQITTDDAVRDLVYSGYNSSIINPVNGSRTINIVGAGITQLIVSWRGFHAVTTFRVVNQSSDELGVKKVEPLAKLDTAKNYHLDLSNSDNCQPKIRVTYNNGSWAEKAGSEVAYSNYNSNIISLNTSTGVVRAKAVGTTSLTMTVGGKSTTVNINVTDQGMSTMDFTDYNKAPMTKLLVRPSDTNTLGTINYSTDINLQRGYLRLKQTGNDPSVVIDNSLGNINANSYTKMKIEYRLISNKDTVISGIYLADQKNTFNAERHFTFNLNKSEDFTTIEVDLPANKGWNNTYNKYIRFDFLENGNVGDVLEIKKITFLP